MQIIKMAAPQFAKCLLLISIRFLALCLSPQVSLIFHFFFFNFTCVILTVVWEADTDCMPFPRKERSIPSAFQIYVA